MWTMEQLDAVGALVVAGTVHFNGELVSGLWTEQGFQPADGGALSTVEKPKAAKATPKA